MPRTPDRRPGVLREEGILFDVRPLAAVGGEVRYSGTRFSMRDSAGEFDPRGGGALPAASQLGQVLISIDGAAFGVQLPITSCNGWLVTDTGELMVVG